MTFLRSFHIGLRSPDKMAEFIDSVNESIEAMRKAVKILAFGLDYKKYIKFRLLIPEPIWYIRSDMPKGTLNQNAKISKENLNFCINYLIECSLKLQEFDFEISKKDFEKPPKTPRYTAKVYKEGDDKSSKSKSSKDERG